MLTLQQASQWLTNAAPVGDMSVSVLRVVTDTRSLRAGDLFVALKGDIFDAHDFLLRARVLGAVAAIAEHGIAAAGLPGLEVADTRLALGELAASWRARFEVPLIAVTGSNGKTTVTQMIACILGVWKHDKAFATEGNFNNDIGVPLTLLRLTASHEVGVVELGMNHPGEIAYLAKLVKPCVALINNAQREHLEFMGSVDAVADENAAVLASLPTDGIAVFPADDTYTAQWRRLAGSRHVLTFGLRSDAPDADITATAVWHADHWQVTASAPSGPLFFLLHIAGRHNVKNALAACACAIAAGVPLTAIAKGLSDFAPVKGRSRAVSLRVNERLITLVDDTYNANPDSMQAAIEVLAELPSPRLLVIGDMGEVGNESPRFHQEAGDLARSRRIDHLFTLGEQSAYAQQAYGAAEGLTSHHFSDVDTLLAAVQSVLPSINSVLVKGSRFMKMERVVQALEKQGFSSAQTPPTTSKETPHAA